MCPSCLWLTGGCGPSYKEVGGGWYLWETAEVGLPVMRAMSCVACALSVLKYCGSDAFSSTGPARTTCIHAPTTNHGHHSQAGTQPGVLRTEGSIAPSRGGLLKGVTMGGGAW